MLLLIALVAICLTILGGSVVFTCLSLREQEPRAPKIGAVGIAVQSALTLAVIFFPGIRIPLAVVCGLGLVTLAVLLIPRNPRSKALQGAAGYVEGKFQKMDERDIVFARNRSVRPDSEQYRVYYQELHPELKEGDEKRRALGGPLGKPGSIDGWRPNSSMLFANFQLPYLLGPHAEAGPLPGHPPADLDPGKATAIVKGLARHLGAVAVGVCKVDPRWGYSHRGEIFYGNWEDWGRAITDPLPYAVVFATEMDHELVGAGPHTPAVVESTANYALGAYVSTILAQWFSAMGYRGEAEHNRHYNHLLVPLAIDAGLGELGRFGYLISDQVGARCRLFACLTDMPLAPDEPVDLGAEAFCERCMKCAESCPSRSIPTGEKTLDRGLLRWKMNAETCFAYWGKIGTDCSVCMGVCPFSRPNHSIHKLMRWLLRRFPLVATYAPYVDNFLYGKRWKPRRVPPWVDYPGRKDRPEVPDADETPPSYNSRMA